MPKKETTEYSKTLNCILLTSKPTSVLALSPGCGPREGNIYTADFRLMADFLCDFWRDSGGVFLVLPFKPVLRKRIRTLCKFSFICHLFCFASVKRGNSFNDIRVKDVLNKKSQEIIHSFFKALWNVNTVIRSETLMHQHTHTHTTKFTLWPWQDIFKNAHYLQMRALQ